MNRSLFSETYKTFKQYKVSDKLAKQAAYIIASDQINRSTQEQKLIQKVWRQIYIHQNR